MTSKRPELIFALGRTGANRQPLVALSATASRHNMCLSTLGFAPFGGDDLLAGRAWGGVRFAFKPPDERDRACRFALSRNRLDGFDLSRFAKHSNDEPEEGKCKNATECVLDICVPVGSAPVQHIDADAMQH